MLWRDRGVTLTNAHCQAPICNPSRVSMFLGKLPSTTGMYFLGPNFPHGRANEKRRDTVSDLSAARAILCPPAERSFMARPIPTPFDHVERSTGWRRGKEKLHYKLPGTNPLWDWGQVDVPDEEQRDYMTAAWAAEELAKLASEDQPFFLAVGFHLPHVPIYASKKWFDLYPLDQVHLPATTASDREDLPEIAKLLTLNPTGAATRVDGGKSASGGMRSKRIWQPTALSIIWSASSWMG